MSKSSTKSELNNSNSLQVKTYSNQSIIMVTGLVSLACNLSEKNPLDFLFKYDILSKSGNSFVVPFVMENGKQYSLIHSTIIIVLALVFFLYFRYFSDEHILDFSYKKLTAMFFLTTIALPLPLWLLLSEELPLFGFLLTTTICFLILKWSYSLARISIKLLAAELA